MAVLKNKTQGNFTMISNAILKDTELRMKDRGVLCTLTCLPDGWEFSQEGLAKIVPDGVDAIKTSLRRLEALGYIKRTKKRDSHGKFITEIEVFSERQPTTDLPPRISHHGKSNDGFSVADNRPQYNTNKYNNINKKYNNQSINLSVTDSKNDGTIDEIERYRALIADNIKLDWLLEVAETRGDTEVAMVNEIYEMICNMVCYPREKVVIMKTSYPWSEVKSQYLKLRYQHIAGILNRIVDAELEIKNMSAYLISALYSASLVGTLEAQANIHDSYLKFLRGKPYME